MGKPALESIKSVVAELHCLRKIPKAYHVDLEIRCVILWGKPERKLGTAYGVRERTIVSRERQAQRTYSEVQEENCHILLPFMLAIRPRACKGFVQMRKMIAEFSTFRLDLGTSSKELLNGMAVKNKFDKNPDYISFIESLFPAGEDLQRESTEDFELIQRVIERRGLSENFTCVEFLKLMFPEKYSRRQWVQADRQESSDEPEEDSDQAEFETDEPPTTEIVAERAPSPLQPRKRRHIEDERALEIAQMEGLAEREIQRRGPKTGGAETQKLRKRQEEIEYWCSKAPISQVWLLGERLFEAVQSGHQWKLERDLGGLTTDCLNALVPKNRSQDISITLMVGHKKGAELIEKFMLSRLKPS